jgi:class 3 adenylate cyclase
VPRTFLAKWQIVEGERAARAGRVEAALGHLNSAIALAEAERNLHELGLAHQLAARCLEAAGFAASAQPHRLAADRAFHTWGATRLASGRVERGPRALESLMPALPAPQALDIESVVRVAQALSEKLRVEDIVREVLSLAVSSAGATRGALLLRDLDGELKLHAVGQLEGGVQIFDPPESDLGRWLPTGIVRYVLRTGEVVVVGDASLDQRLLDAEYASRGVRSLLAAPMRLQGEVRGVLLVENALAPHAFTPGRSRLLEVMASQAAISLQNGRLYRDLERLLEAQTALTTAHARFVPHQFLAALGRANIQDVELGDCVSRELSVLFSDVRGFTPLIECLGPAESIRFINDYLAHMEPAIVENGGFVDSYVGDAIMALFEGRADDAVSAGIAMLRGLARFNDGRAARGQAAVRIGIGINTGPIMLGTIGGPNNMKCGVIGDTVNLAARIESLTKQFDATLLIGADTVRRLADPARFALRPVERVQVIGRTEPVTLYEVYDVDPPELRAAKTDCLGRYLEGLEAYYAHSFGDAAAAFEACVTRAPQDVRAQAFLLRARSLIGTQQSDWDGVVRMTTK